MVRRVTPVTAVSLRRSALPATPVAISASDLDVISYMRRGQRRELLFPDAIARFILIPIIGTPNERKRFLSSDKTSVFSWGIFISTCGCQIAALVRSWLPLCVALKHI